MNGQPKPPPPEFKGYMDPISNSVEQRIWTYISLQAAEALSKYKSTIDKDDELLEIDNRTSMLTTNQRNCLLYIRGEKQVLHFLKDCANKAVKVLKMNKQDALEEISSWKDSSKIANYFSDTIAT